MSARPDHCHEEIDNIVDGSTEPCGIKPVGWRIDPEANQPYPVCALHHRWPYADEWVDLRARLLAANDRLAEAEARVRRVEALHRKGSMPFVSGDCANEECDHEDDCPEEPRDVCSECWERAEEISPYFAEQRCPEWVMWPCPTTTALAPTTDKGATR